MAGSTKVMSATGVVFTTPVHLKSILLIGGSEPATLSIKPSTDGSGTEMIYMGCPASIPCNWVSVDLTGIPFYNGVHATFTGAGAKATFEYQDVPS